MKNNVSTTAGIFGLLCLVLVLFFIWPLLTDIQHNSENFVLIRNDTAAIGRENDEIENFKKVYPDDKPNLDKMSQLFIDPQNPVSLIEFLESTAKNSSITLQVSLSPAPQTPQAKTQNFITLQLSASDDFLKIMRYLQALENGPYLLEIESMTAKLSDAQNGSKNPPPGQVDVNVSLNAFTNQ